MEYFHEPVLLKEVLEILNPKKGENFVDATLGGGGYTQAILRKNQPGGKVLAIDLDQKAIENFQLLISSSQTNHKSKIINPKSVILAQGNFSGIDKVVEKHKFYNISGIVADIGLSSFQLDASGRGISFQKDETLDMRFDHRSDQPDAKFYLNNYSEKELAEIFYKFSEEKHSRQIAKKIVTARQAGEIKRTGQLLEIITEALPKPVKHKANDSARRIFQALRIKVNSELENLQTFLPKALDLLEPGGRLVIVSFHSLEDRIVKQFFREASKGCVCPVDFPECRCGKNPQAKLLTRKPVTATVDELVKNSRSKPAKLRAIVKL